MTPLSRVSPDTHTHSKHSMSELLTRWQQAAVLLRVCPGGLPLFCLVDANARLGPRLSSRVGPLGAQRESASGRILRDLLDKRTFGAPATFPGRSEPRGG